MCAAAVKSLLLFQQLRRRQYLGRAHRVVLLGATVSTSGAVAAATGSAPAAAATTSAAQVRSCTSPAFSLHPPWHVNQQSRCASSSRSTSSILNGSGYGVSSKGSTSRRSPLSASAARLSGAASSGSTGGGGGAGADAGADGFLSGTGASYAEQMLISWRRDPSSVHASWAAYFANLEAGMPPSLCFVPPPSLQHSAAAGGGAAGAAAGAGAAGAVGIGGLKALGVPSAASVSVSSPPGAGGGGTTGGAIGGAAGGGTDLGESAGTAAEGSGLLALYEDAPQSVHDTSRLIQMVRGYQTRGHELASIDPLCLPRKPPYCSVRAAQQPLHLAPEHYGFTAADLEKVFVTRVPGMQGFLSPASPPRRLRDLLRRLQETYCSSLGVEYMHISDSNACNFLRQRLETDQAYAFSRESRRKILARLARAQLFENFCATKFSTTRRFGLDGCETLIVGMKAITKRAVASGLESVVIGMAHRGRLNVLVNVLHKPMQQILSEFQGVSGYGGSEWGNTGDVKYHLGVEFDLFDRDLQRNIHMCVLPNPSHLEAVDPLVLGLTRAQQYFRRDSERSLVLPIIVHGDASLAGQGVVYETLQMSSLPGYCVGGAIHLVVNNQIGFTTNPVDAGSGKYCTDIAKAVEAPILHVNADDPEAVSFACELALEFRQKFKHDVFVDIVGYRRFGHNELDMPKFTQPLTYTLIARKKTALELYSNKLIQQEVMTEEDVSRMKSEIWEFYNKEYESSKTFVPANQCQYAPQWKHLVTPDHPSPPRVTGVRLSALRELGRRIFTIPEGFVPHATIAKIKKQRLAAVEGPQHEKSLDFGAAENLAYATLLSDGFHVRLAGQDAQRGTFSHRHAVLHDQAVEAQHCIFDGLKDLNLPHSITVCNSPLSEYAGLVMLLPHGYDGQGPEHSSARIERFLQLCDDREDVIHEENWELSRSSVIQQHNIQVVVPTVPANIFHVLRRQVHRAFRKPLVVFSPKRMLRLRQAMSSLEDIMEGTRFRRYIPDELIGDPLRVERLILCCGQIYYDLLSERERIQGENNDPDNPGNRIALARVEQLSPFPFDLAIRDIQRYPNLRSVVWAQEEPMNQGAWGYTSKRIESCLRHLGHPNKIERPVYVGRDVSATTAVGDKGLHDKELLQLLLDAFNLECTDNSYLSKYLSRRVQAEQQQQQQKQKRKQQRQQQQEQELHQQQHQQQE